MRWSFWIFVACGVVAGCYLSSIVPSGLRSLELSREAFRLARAADDLLEITESRWLFLPFQYGDFDLEMDVELGEGAELDVLLRRVEPRIVGEQLLPFTGRFTVLRLSTEGDGPGWRTRDEALFGTRGGGVGVAPGWRSTVWIEGRGRMLRANVAGKQQPWQEADDRYGMFTMLCRGGKAVVHRLAITPRDAGTSWRWSEWTWGALGGLGAFVVGLMARALDRRPPSHLAAGLVLVLLSRWLARHVEFDLMWPPLSEMAFLLVVCLGAALLLVFRSLRGVPLVLGGCIVGLAGEFVLQGMKVDTRAVDEVFGPDAGSQPSEALAQLVRGPEGAGLHDVGRPGVRVFLLGGQLLYDRGAPTEHLEILLTGQLRARAKQPVDVPCLPTVDGWPQQQWRLFEGFYTGYRPRVVVLGIGAGADAVDEARAARRTSREELAATIAKARTWCDANGARLVLFHDRGLSEPLRAALLEAEAVGVPSVAAGDGETPDSIARRLAETVAPLLE